MNTQKLVFDIERVYYDDDGNILVETPSFIIRAPHRTYRDLGKIYGMVTIGMGGGGAIGAWLGGALHDLTGGYAVGQWVGIASLCIAGLPFLLVRSMART